MLKNGGTIFHKYRSNKPLYGQKLYEMVDFTGISKSKCFLKRRAEGEAFLMYEGFVIPVKSYVDYLN